MPTDIEFPRWIHGAPAKRRRSDPPIQVHRHDERTFVLRQSKDLSYEAPFLYLLCGTDAALLLDTGATADADSFPLRATVDRLLPDRPGYRLIVAHSHAHGDHVAADAQFADRPDTTVVGTELDAVRAQFGLADEPYAAADLDLGDRLLHVVHTPGHHRASITLHDPHTGWLLTGDTVYPGRLYVEDYPAFLGSLDRMVALTEERPVTAVLGTHIEMTDRPRRDYPLGSTWQPREHRLQLSVDELTAIRDGARGFADRPGVHRMEHVVIFHGFSQRRLRYELARHYLYQARSGVAALFAGGSA